MVRGRKPDRKRRQQIAALRARGLTLAAIGQALGVSRQCVHKILHRMGQPPPVRSVPCCGCGRAIVSAGAYSRDRGAALCLPYLAKRPAAPFAQRLQAFRLAAGLTKVELADRCGMSHPAIHDCETGAYEPPWRSVIRLVEVLGVGLVALGFEGFTLPSSPAPPATGKRHRPRKPR